MKNKALCLSLVFAFGAVSLGSAAEVSSKDEQKLDVTSSSVDKDAAQEPGKKAVESRLKAEFKAEDARIQALRAQKLSYGEISIALAISAKMPGGSTDANIQLVVSQRQGPPVMGWGQVAKKDGVKLGRIISRVKRLEAAVRKQEKTDLRKQEKKDEKAEKAIKADKADAMEKAEKVEKVDKIEKEESLKH